MKLNWLVRVNASWAASAVGMLRLERHQAAMRTQQINVMATGSQNVSQAGASGVKVMASAQALISTMEYINGTWLEKTSNWALSRSAFPAGTVTRRFNREYTDFITCGGRHQNEKRNTRADNTWCILN